MVKKIIIKNSRVTGIELQEGNTLECDALIIASGTFLNGTIFVGMKKYSSGRANEPASTELADQIKQLGFKTMRLKTGTPMRVHMDSVDWTVFEPQPGDETPQPFSVRTRRKPKNLITCYLGHTNSKTHEVIRDNIDKSPLFSGIIDGIGPRYCPSIEDKVVKFEHRKRHHFYLEPEGLNNKEIYVNGLSTSLPLDVQYQILKSVKGLDKSRIMRPAYAIEYDSIDPRALRHTLESREIPNLYFCGQVNGTSGYEEAAAQGLVAGINSVLSLKGEEPFIPSRSESYTGVLIDDIVTKGVDEPYRLFTSRAEYRLQIREDNAFDRMGHYALRYNLIDEKLYQRETKKIKARQRTIEKIKSLKAVHNKRRYSLYHLLKMPEFNFRDIETLSPEKLPGKRNLMDISYIEAAVKYEGYIKIQRAEAEKLKNLKTRVIPEDLDFNAIEGLSTEVRQKLIRQRPGNLDEALKIPGITPASINAISIHLTLYKKKVQETSS